MGEEGVERKHNGRSYDSGPSRILKPTWWMPVLLAAALTLSASVSGYVMVRQVSAGEKIAVVEATQKQLMTTMLAKMEELGKKLDKNTEAVNEHTTAIKLEEQELDNHIKHDEEEMEEVKGRLKDLERK